MKDEAYFKSELMKRLRKVNHLVALRHEDLFTSGIPDISITANKMTSWWEAKHATPDFESKDIQALTCKRLDAHGLLCRYLLFYDYKDVQEILIVRPHDIWLRLENGKYWSEFEIIGFNYDDLVQYILKQHKML